MVTARCFQNGPRIGQPVHGVHEAYAEYSIGFYVLRIDSFPAIRLGHTGAMLGTLPSGVPRARLRSSTSTTDKAAVMIMPRGGSSTTRLPPRALRRIGIALLVTSLSSFPSI